jgi:hypothetical protein
LKAVFGEGLLVGAVIGEEDDKRGERIVGAVEFLMGTVATERSVLEEVRE